MQGAIKGLPDKMKRTELLKIMRRVAKPTAEAAKRNLKSRNVTGVLEKSIGNITSKNKKYPNILVGPRIKGKHGGYYGHLVEFGHGGPKPAPARPFMRPAYDETKGQVTADAAAKVAAYLEKRANQLN